MKETCGLKLSESFASYDHDTHSWKTSQISLLTNTLAEYSETWPKAGTMQDGRCYRQPKLEQHIKEIDFGLWPTPRVVMIHNKEERLTIEGRLLVNGKQKFGIWKTPTARDWKGPHGREYKMRTGKESLPGQIMFDQKNEGSLNPDWVELLMGWIKGWTSLNPINYSEYKLWLKRFQDEKNQVSTRYGRESWFDDSWEFNVPRVATNIKNRVDRLKAIGNGQVPLQAAIAWKLLSELV